MERSDDSKNELLLPELLFFKPDILLGETITIQFHHFLHWSQDFTSHIFYSFFPLNASNGSSREDETV